MSKLSSAEVLERIWLRFVKQYEDRFGVKLSMRGFSTEVLNFKSELERKARPGQDAQALSRWINPGERENYRIPLTRISEVCRHMDASADDIDDLMAARLWEVSLANPSHETLVVGEWVADVYARSDRMTPDETVLLKLYRDATQHLDRRLLQAPDDQVRLTVLLGDFLAPAWKEFWDEQAVGRAENAALTEDELRGLVAKQQRVLKTVLRQREMERAEARDRQMRERSAMPAQRTAKQLLKEIRARAAR